MEQSGATHPKPFPPLLKVAVHSSSSTIVSQNNPNVKLVTTEDGSGMVLGGQSAYVQILSRGANPFLKILNKDGRQQVIKP